jgi:hypothetical protein
MAISLGRFKQHRAKEQAMQKLQKQAEKAGKAEGKRKKKAGFWGKVGGTVLGAAAVGLTMTTGGLAAPLIMGVASSLGKKWADDASKGGGWFGKALKTPGQVESVKATDPYGYGKDEAKSITEGLRESRKSNWSVGSMGQDIAMSYLTAGVTGGLGGAKDALKAGNVGAAIKGTGAGTKWTLEGGIEGMKQSMSTLIPGGEGASDFAYDPKAGKIAMTPPASAPISITDNITQLTPGEISESSLLDGNLFSEETLGAFELDAQGNPVSRSIEREGGLIYQQGGQVQELDEHTLIGLSILSQMANQRNQQTAYSGTPLEEEQQPTISEVFATKNKTLGGNSTKSLSQLMER